MKKIQPELTRRCFLKKSSALALSSYAISHLGYGSLLNASTSLASSTDYKAMVFIFLAGGNDAFNMIVPKGPGALRDRYESARGIIALPSDNLHSLNLQSDVQHFDGEEYNDFGMHPGCGAMAELFNNQELGVICNVGNILEPTTREAYFDKSVQLPPQLYSHSDQQRQFQSEPTSQFRTGWGGKIADLLSVQNPSDEVSPLISVSGLNAFQTTSSDDLSTYVLGKSGLINLTQFTNERADMVNAYMTDISDDSHLMSKKYQQTYFSAQKAQTVLQGAFQIAESNGVDYDTIFSDIGDQELATRLKTVAKMIAGKAANTNQRPIYFVKMGGFDTHQNVLQDHQLLMAELSTGMKAFRDALVQQGDFDSVLTFVGSEFARTLTPNGNNADTGTDHAWGGHAMVMGGMIEGGHFYGTHPDFRLGEGLDTDKARGRWIPTTSVSQCSAVIANWMGIAIDDLQQISPSLSNFPDPLDTETNLRFIKPGGTV